MNMRLRYMPILLLLTFVSSSDCFSQDLQFTPSNVVILKKFNGKKLMNQCSRCMPKNTKKFFDVSLQEKQQMEARMKAIYGLSAMECYGIQSPQKITDLTLYFYQYMGVVIKGKHYIYINAFPPGFANEMQQYAGEDWHITPALVCDGGPAFWGVFFNLETNEFHYLSFNGRI